MKRADIGFVLAHPAHLLAFGFGTGLAPKAPGTWGTLVAFPIYLALAFLGSTYYWGVVVLFLVAGIWICDKTGKALGIHDFGGIVWDEIAAFLMVLPFAPQNWWGYLVAFALFRVFDIWKPFPIAWFDRRIGGGLGVMLDAVLAAAYAIIILYLLKPWIC